MNAFLWFLRGNWAGWAISAAIAGVLVYYWHSGQMDDAKQAHTVELQSLLLENEKLYTDLVQTEFKVQNQSRRAHDTRTQKTRTIVKEIIKEVEKPIVRTVEIPGECPPLRPSVDQRVRLFVERANDLIGRTEAANAALEAATRSE